MTIALISAEIGGGSLLGVIEKSYGNRGIGALWYVATTGIAFAILSIFAIKLRSSMVKTVPEYFKDRSDKISGALLLSL